VGIKLTLASSMLVFGLALAGSAQPASADLITVDFTVDGPFSCVGFGSCTPTGPFGMSMTADIQGSFVVDTTKSGADAYQSVSYSTGSISWDAADLQGNGQNFISFSGDTVTAFTMDFGNENFVSFDHAGNICAATCASANNQNTFQEVQSLSVIIDSQAVTPLPAALPLFATGLGGLGLLGWRRKRKPQAVA
jgi:hypothetical protein